ncbi:Polypeptide-transport-associated domain protein ShlB-type [Methylotenera versatilis 301]|uniref:Polypeptide-transport-associated domain protein ShlB-type n=2 Tax=Methylotenera TaxID=359407 RepID=D7DNV6_METV0|nr:Polypeptide-transport-associated domain protein ShlB-type [Methylotenera versatilis 301]
MMNKNNLMVLNNSANIKGLLLMFLIAMPMSALADDALLTDAKTQAKPAIVESSANDEQKPVEKNPSFNVFEFQIDGNTVLPKGKLEEAVYPFLGEAKTIDDVEKARSALEKTYQDAGYLTVSVSIPQQEVNQGLVILKVTEGSIEKLRVKDSKYTSLAEIKSRVPEFEEGKVPNFPVAQQQLGTVNRGQNRQVTPVLRPGKSPGKVEVDLKVQDQLPVHGSLEVNDKYSQNTTKTRINGSVRYENLWQKDHSIGISFQLSPENTDEVQVVSATYLIPRMNGDYFAAYGVLSESSAKASSVGDLSVVGNNNILGARYIHPLPMLENYYHSATVGADYKDSNDSASELPISYTAFMLGYDGTLQNQDSQTQFNLGLNFSVRGLGNKEEQFAYKRYLAQPNYVYLRSELKHTQKLSYDWSILAKLGGQVANGPLISAEQFAMGGVDSVRGYVESSALGDNGIMTSFELHTPPLKKFIKSDFVDFKELYAFSFVDAARVSIYDPLPGQTKTSDLLSVGLGVKLKTNSGIFTNLDYAHTLRDAGDVKNGDDRLHFKVGYEW